jgi:hypothetical protein
MTKAPMSMIRPGLDVSAPLITTLQIFDKEVLDKLGLVLMTSA